jgi:hypothetical protein
VPLFETKLSTEQFPINEWISREERKQLLTSSAIVS